MLIQSYKKQNKHSHLFKDKYQDNQSSICSTVAKHLTRKPKIKGLNPATGFCERKWQDVNVQSVVTKISAEVTVAILALASSGNAPQV